MDADSRWMNQLQLIAYTRVEYTAHMIWSHLECRCPYCNYIRIRGLQYRKPRRISRLKQFPNWVPRDIANVGAKTRESCCMFHGSSPWRMRIKSTADSEHGDWSVNVRPRSTTNSELWCVLFIRFNGILTNFAIASLLYMRPCKNILLSWAWN